MNLFRSLATVSSFTLLSRITGLVRDMLITRLFGASAETDAFNVAFRLPNLLRRLFGEGAFQQAFVPMLADVRARGDEATTVSFAGHVASALFWTPLLVSVPGVIAAPALVWLIIIGNADWALASIAILFTGLIAPNTLGIIVIAGQALAVALFAELEFIGQRRVSAVAA